jgi:hypothetical protein
LMERARWMTLLTILTIAVQTSHGQEYARIQAGQETKHKHAEIFGRQTVRRVLADKSFLALSAGVYAGVAFDMHSTVNLKRWYNVNDPPFTVSMPFSDKDPLARPFVNLPTPAYYASGFAFATGINWVAWKMKHSSRFRKVWWIPQLMPVGNVYCGIQNTRYYDQGVSAWKRSKR